MKAFDTDQAKVEAMAIGLTEYEADYAAWNFYNALDDIDLCDSCGVEIPANDYCDGYTDTCKACHEKWCKNFALTCLKWSKDQYNRAPRCIYCHDVIFFNDGCTCQS